MNTLEEMLCSRRSIRTYEKKPVEPEKIRYMLKSALFSPTSKGIQSRSIIVADDPQLLSTLSRSKEHGADFLAEAPLAFVVAADTEKAAAWIEDCSIAAITLQYAAEELGLGSCWIQIRRRYTPDGISASEYIKERLSLPDHFEVEAIVSAGHPTESLKPHSDNELPWESIRYNEYSRPFS